jgi:GGDEF domain-containing protein
MTQAALNPDGGGILAALPREAPAGVQWRLLESAFAVDASPGSVAVLVPAAGFAAYAMTSPGVYAPGIWLVWAILGLAAVAVRVRLAASFEQRSEQRSWAIEPPAWAQRHRVGAWGQSALLGVGGFYAVISGNVPASLAVFGCLAFVSAAESASATLPGTARGQASLALGMPILAGLAGGQVWQLAIAALGTLELACCMLLIGRCQVQALATAKVIARADNVEKPLVAVPTPAAEDFQRLLGRDQITGLPNRHGFMHILAEESRRAHDAAMPLSLVLISIEGLPEEDFAWAREKRLMQLSACASAIRRSLYRVMDQMACLSPARLAVLLPFTDALGADVVARKIAQVLRPEGDPAEEGTMQLGSWAQACIGTATYSGKGALPATYLFECALEAETSARKAGGNRIARFDPLAANMRREGDYRPAPIVAAVNAPAEPEPGTQLDTHPNTHPNTPMDGFFHAPAGPDFTYGPASQNAEYAAQESWGQG